MAVEREDSLYKRVTRLDSQIRIEFDLVSSRVSWLLISNAFLLSAYVLVQNIATTRPFQASIHNILIWSIPILGFVSSILVWGAILAAHKVINHLKANRDKVEKDLRNYFSHEEVGISADSTIHKIGNLPPLVLPLFLMCIWICILCVTYKASSGIFTKLVLTFGSGFFSA